MNALISEPRQLMTADLPDAADWVCRIVGGVAEAHYLPEYRPFRAYRNLEGAELGLEHNVLGTLLFREFGIIGINEAVLGTVLFLGADADGNPIDCPEWLFDLAKTLLPDTVAICNTPTTVAN